MISRFQRLPRERVKALNAQLKQVVIHAKNEQWDDKVSEFVSKLLTNAGVAEQ